MVGSIRLPSLREAEPWFLICDRTERPRPVYQKHPAKPELAKPRLIPQCGSMATLRYASFYADNAGARP